MSMVTRKPRKPGSKAEEEKTKKEEREKQNKECHKFHRNLTRKFTLRTRTKKEPTMSSNQGTVDAKTIKTTQDSLSKLIKKPVLTEKLLKRPPFKFLHDIIVNVINSTGFMKDVFSSDDLNPTIPKEKGGKIAFLQSVIDQIESTLGKPVDVKAAKIVAGLESDKTNQFLQQLAKAAAIAARNSKTSSSSPSASASTKSIPASTTTSKSTVKGSNVNQNRINTNPPANPTSHPTSNTTSTNAAINRSKTMTRPGKKSSPASPAWTRTQPNGSRQGTKANKTRIKSSAINSSANSRPNSESGNKETAQMDRQLNRQLDPRIGENDNVTVAGHSNDRENDEGAGLRGPFTADHLGGAGEDHNNGTDINVDNRNNSSKNKGNGEHDENDENDASGSGIVGGDGGREADERTRRDPEDNEADGPGESVTVDNSSTHEPQKGLPQLMVRPPTGLTSSHTPRASPRPSARPTTARAAPPKVVTKRELEDSSDELHQSRILSSSEPVENLISERGRLSTARGRRSAMSRSDDRNFADDDEDSMFVVQEARDELSGSIEASTLLQGLQVDGDEDKSKGSLVKQLIETKAALEGSIDSVNSTSEHLTNRLAAKDINKLREHIQKLTQLATPLGRILDYLSEDINSIVSELKSWAEEHSKNLIQLQEARSSIDSHSEPLRVQLDHLDNDIARIRESISIRRASIFRNEEKIERIVKLAVE